MSTFLFSAERNPSLAMSRYREQIPKDYNTAYPYHCVCRVCSDWRVSWISQGDTVVPATYSSSQGTIAWLPRTAEKWSYASPIPGFSPAARQFGGDMIYLEVNGISHGTVIARVDPQDQANRGWIDSIFVLWSDGTVRVVAASTMASMSSPLGPGIPNRLALISDEEAAASKRWQTQQRTSLYFRTRVVPSPIYPASLGRGSSSWEDINSEISAAKAALPDLPPGTFGVLSQQIPKAWGIEKKS